jgi:hypothetical protein
LLEEQCYGQCGWKNINYTSLNVGILNIDLQIIALNIFWCIHTDNDNILKLSLILPKYR